ncbi:meckelin [Apis dorsata]|uniref:meckelin n=1 Tax=Apis dorsata TaxID=7462 RepID=UPI001293B3B0|nr:meckelin [Apis dorsata]
MIKTFTVIAFFSKFIEILGFICQYWNIDIFFIDWEQPKIINNQFDKQKTENSISKISTQIMNKDSNFDNLPISIWRTYFIANKWLNLQTKRKINIMIQLLAVLCIFQIIQLCPWIVGIPELTFILSENNYDFILYYTICTLIYILIYCIHWLISIIFFEQCIINRISVHGFADTDLPTLINNLQMEKNNLCAHRGLVPGTTQQTFILYLTKTFRITFNKNLKLTNIVCII